MGFCTERWPARFAALLACVVVLQPIQVSASVVPVAAGAIRGAFVELGILSKEAPGQIAGRERLQLEANKTRVSASSLFTPVTPGAGDPQLDSSSRSGGDGFEDAQSLPFEFRPGRSPPR
jgi:hypothetical protein